MSYYAVPPNIYIGKGALQESESSFHKCGRKALIVTGRHIAKSPMMEKLKNLLDKTDISYIVFDGITGEPTDRMIEEGLSLFKKEKCDFCIGIGGGSPLDSAKAIAAMSVLPGVISDYNGMVMNAQIPPIVAIPTTAGTGSEATRFTIITDQKRDIKMLLKGDCLLPFLVIAEPDFTMDMPKSVTAATGLDALTHAVEAFTSKKAIPLTDTLAVSAVKRIMKFLPIAYDNGDDERAREEMALAALEAGICINNSSVTLVHGMSRPIGALFHVSHGMSNAMLLEECLRFALDGAYERFGELGRIVGAAKADDSDELASEKFLAKIGELCRKCQVPSFQEAGISKDSFIQTIDKMASDAVASGSPGNTRKMVTEDNCVAIYKLAYAGKES